MFWRKQVNQHSQQDSDSAKNLAINETIQFNSCSKLPGSQRRRFSTELPTVTQETLINMKWNKLKGLFAEFAAWDPEKTQRERHDSR